MIANSLLLIFFYLIPLYLAELFSYSFVLGLLLKTFQFAVTQISFKNKTVESELLAVRFSQDRSSCHIMRRVFLSQKQDIVKLTPAYFIGIFLSNSVYNKPLTQYRCSCHKRQSFTSDEIID